jgi:hypothetical protein
MGVRELLAIHGAEEIDVHPLRDEADASGAA